MKRALVSVANKEGIVEFCDFLNRKSGIEIVSTGGTRKHLEAAGLNVTDVSQVTGFPEILNHRVKVLHPNIFGGLLANLGSAHDLKDLETHGIRMFDLVVVDLYDLKGAIEKAQKGEITKEDVVESIDVGGPSMLAACVKNRRYVTVVPHPSLYRQVMDDLNEHGEISETKRRAYVGMALRCILDHYTVALNYLTSDDMIK